MIRFEVVIDRKNLSREHQHELQKAIEAAVQETAAGFDVEPPLEFLPLKDALKGPSAKLLENVIRGGHTAGIWSPPPDFELKR